jgi:predicted transcriptional regulator
MFQLAIDDQLASRLKAIAEREQRTVEDVLEEIVQHYEVTALPHEATEEQMAALDALIGFIDEDITDLSMTVRETMTEFYRRKYDGTD